MGLYYSPPPPHIGAAQPVTQKELTPASGPAASNPPRLRSAALAAVIATTWPGDPGPLPQTSPKRVPPTVAASVQPPQGGVPAAVLASWYQPAVPQAPVAINRDPPQAGPTPQNPPFMGGARISAAALIAWLPPPPLPPAAINLNPPISGPQNPPFAGGAQIPSGLSIWYLPQPAQPPTAVNLVPLATPQNPPLLGSQVSEAILASWLAPQFLLPPALQRVPLAPTTFAPPSKSWIWSPQGATFVSGGAQTFTFTAAPWVWSARAATFSLPVRPFVPPVRHNIPPGQEDAWRIEVARKLNALLNQTASVILTPGATTTTLTDRRIGMFSHVTLSPKSASAATALASVYIVPGNGSAVIHHPSNAATDQIFSVLIV